MVPSLPYWYFALLGGVALLRLIELRVSARHQARLLSEGATKVREPHYPVMVGVHVGVFIASAVEVWYGERPFLPLLGWSMVAVLAVCLLGRLWVWRALGEQWNVQIMVSSRPIISSGPYQYVRHPNYTIVIIEMAALPLVHSAYLTALSFSALNAGVLWRRIRHEEAVLCARPEYVAAMGTKPRFLPSFARGR